MRDYAAFRKSAIRYWERKRLAYNLALVLPTLFGYGLYAGVSAGVGDPRKYGPGVVIFLYAISALGANICYSFCYALEFWFGSDNPDSRWVAIWRTVAFVIGTLFAMVLALAGGHNIAWMEYHP